MKKSEMIARYGQEWYDATQARNRERALRRYYERPETRRTKEQQREASREFRERHPERARASSRVHQRKRRSDPVEKRRMLDRENERRKIKGLTPEQKSAAKRRNDAWRERNREHVNAASRVWHAANPEVGRVNSVVRAMRVRAGGSFDKEFVAWLRRQPCVDCGSTDRIEVGHRVSIRNGGTNDPANLLPQCRSCNRRLSGKNHRSIGDHV